MRDIGEDKRIDENALDVEWLRQADIFGDWALESAQASKRHRDAKAALDVIRAERAQAIRSAPEKYIPNGKLTEGALSEVLTLDPEVRGAQAAVSEAELEADTMKAAVRTMEQKKEGIEWLVRLLGMSYFAGPSIPRDLREEAAKARGRMRDEAVGRVRDRITGRRGA